MTMIFKTEVESGPKFIRERLRLVSKRLRAEHEFRVETRRANFDSGLPLEDYFRHAISELLEPYGVNVGNVVDRDGFSPGECDVVIFDKALAPLLVQPSSPYSRQKWFAFETTYGIIEVKQSLTLGALGADTKLLPEPKGTLYDACKKIFAYKQLTRTLDTPLKWGTNAPMGFIFCYGYDGDLETNEALDSLLREFIRINDVVPVEQRVNGLYVLDRGSVVWSFRESPASSTFRTLQHAAESPGPLCVSFQPTGLDTLYAMFAQLWSLLVRTQLSGPDFIRHYGGDQLVGRDIRAMPASVAATVQSSR